MLLADGTGFSEKIRKPWVSGGGWAEERLEEREGFLGNYFQDG